MGGQAGYVSLDCQGRLRLVLAIKRPPSVRDWNRFVAARLTCGLLPEGWAKANAKGRSLGEKKLLTGPLRSKLLKLAVKRARL